MSEDISPKKSGYALDDCARALRRLPLLLSLLLCFALLLGLSAKASAQIVDTADMFSASTLVRANQIISHLHAKTGKTIFIKTFADIPAHISKAFPHDASLHRLFYQWAGKIGQAEHVNGVVIIICRKPGYLVIRGGKNVLGTLFSRSNQTRAARLMLDLFRSGQYQSGLLTGLQFISATIEQQAASLPGHRQTGESHRVLILLLVLVGIFVAFWLLTRRTRPMEGPPMAPAGGRIDPQTSGLTPNTTPTVPGPAGGSSAMGTFVGGMAGGVAGAVAGNLLFNTVEGQSPPLSSPQQPGGADTDAAASGMTSPDPASDWTGGTDEAAGGAFDDSTGDSGSDQVDASDDASDDGDAGGAF